MAWSFGMFLGLSLSVAAPKGTPEPSLLIFEDSRQAVSAANLVGVANSPALYTWLSTQAQSEEGPLHPDDEPLKLDLSGFAIEDRAPIRTFQENKYEANGYCLALITANNTSLERFAKNGRRDLTFAHLYEEPQKYRGVVVHVEGRIKRIRRFDPPETARRNGVKDLYEGWIFDLKISGANPVCIVFTELPAEFKVGEELKGEVAFDGFFFKRYRYKAGDGTRDSPLLIGRAPVMLPGSPSPGDNGKQMLYTFISLVAGTMLLTLFLAWWYWRGDRRVRAKVVETKHPDFENYGEWE